MPQPLHSLGKRPQCPLEKRMGGGPQGWFGCDSKEENTFLSLQGNEPWLFSP